MYLVAICDDEEYVRSYMRRLIEKQGMNCNIREFSSGKELLESAKEECIDILFLDISMEEMDGMTAARQLRSQARQRGEAIWGGLPLLIFVTGYPEYVKEAFFVHPFQFLGKPIKEKEFLEVLGQAARECRCLGAPGIAGSDRKYHKESSFRRDLLCGKQQPQGNPVPVP